MSFAIAHVGTAKQMLAAAVAGHDDEALHDRQTLRQPEIELHLLALPFALLLHGLAPLLVGDLPVPVSGHDLLRRGRAPFGFIEHAVPAPGVLGRHVRAHPADTVALGKLRKVGPFRAAVRLPRLSPLAVEPRQNFLRPLRAVLAQPFAAEVDALAIALAQFAFQRVAVRSFEVDAVAPERCLRGADLIAAFIAGHVVAGLRDEPGASQPMSRRESRMRRSKYSR